MNKIYLVGRREYVEILRTKAFWIGILVLPVVLALGVTVPLLLARAKEARTFAVLDHSGFLLQEVEERLFAEDLREVFEVAARHRRRQSPHFDRLPGVVQQAALALAALDKDQREDAISRLAASSPPPAEPQLPEETRETLDRLGPNLRQWWQQVSASELDELDLKLSKSRFTRVEVPPGEAEPQAALNRMIDRGGLFAYFVIGADPVASAEGCKYISNNLTDRELLNWFRSRAGTVVRERRIAQERIDPEIARWIQEPLSFQGRKVGEDGEEEKVEIRDTARQWAPVVFVYLLWIAIFTSAQMLLTNMIEEKSDRVVEVLLSSVSPYQLLAGKVAGIAASGLTVVGSWVVFFLIILVAVPGTLGGPALPVGQIVADPLYVFSFLLYFLMGYLLYATILAGIGSVCNSIKETQNLMLPVLLPMLIPLFAMIPVGQDPNGLLARVLSFIPLFTPFVMMNRAAGPPALWEYVLTTLLLLGTIALSVWAAAKIFRIGILMTGKPPRLREIVKWLTLSEGAVPASRERD